MRVSTWTSGQSPRAVLAMAKVEDDCGLITDAVKHDPKFNHPYIPYDVQIEFMKAAFDVLRAGEGRIGILESPTGTVSSPQSTMVHF